jgi:hypothetical protein
LDANSAAAIAAGASVISAVAAVLVWWLNIGLVRATRTSVQAMLRQTEEAFFARVDARAPRVMVTSVRFMETFRPPQVWGGHLAHLSDEQLEAVAAEDADVAVRAVIAVRNEGSVTGALHLPDEPQMWAGSTPAPPSKDVIINPGEVVELTVVVRRPFSTWAAAARSETPVEQDAVVRVSDGYQDGVLDELAVSLLLFAVAQTFDGKFSAAQEWLLAKGTVSGSAPKPIQRSYRTGPVATADAPSRRRWKGAPSTVRRQPGLEALGRSRDTYGGTGTPADIAGARE